MENQDVTTAGAVEFKYLDTLSDLLDSRFRIPGTGIRFAGILKNKAMENYPIRNTVIHVPISVAINRSFDFLKQVLKS